MSIFVVLWRRVYSLRSMEEEACELEGLRGMVLFQGFMREQTSLFLLALLRGTLVSTFLYKEVTYFQILVVKYTILICRTDIFFKNFWCDKFCSLEREKYSTIILTAYYPCF